MTRSLLCLPPYQDALVSTTAAALYRAMQLHCRHPRRVEFEVRCGVLRPRKRVLALAPPAQWSAASTTPIFAMHAPVDADNPTCTPAVLRVRDKSRYTFETGIGAATMRAMLLRLHDSKLVRQHELLASTRHVTVTTIGNVRHVYDIDDAATGVAAWHAASPSATTTTTTATARQHDDAHAGAHAAYDDNDNDGNNADDDDGDDESSSNGSSHVDRLSPSWPPYRNACATWRRSLRKAARLREDMFCPSWAADVRFAVSLEQPWPPSSPLRDQHTTNDATHTDHRTALETLAGVRVREQRRMRVPPYFVIEASQRWQLLDLRALRWREQLLSTASASPCASQQQEEQQQQQQAQPRDDASAAAGACVMAPRQLLLPPPAHWNAARCDVEVEVDVDRLWRDWRRVGGGIAALRGDNDDNDNGGDDDGSGGDDGDARRCRDDGGCDRRMRGAVTLATLRRAARDPFLCSVARDLLTLLQFAVGNDC